MTSSALAEDSDRTALERGLHQVAAEGVHLLHVVGPVTDEVFSFLGPATRALAKHGHVQQIVLIDSPEHRHNVLQFDDYATVIRVTEVLNPFSQWISIIRACKNEFEKDRFGVVHVHGLIPFLLVSVGLRNAGAQTPVVYSPHGSRSLGNLKFVGKLAMLAAHTAVRVKQSSAIVTVPREAAAFDGWNIAHIVESPVSDIFFSVTRREVAKPLILTGGRKNSLRSIEIFTQLAVLLSDEEMGLSFQWLGTVPAETHQSLRAANILVSPVSSDAECAAQMVAGWIYVAPWSTRGFPLFLVQAMAAGLPCVAMDCEQHRGVIEDGITGFLCATEQEMVRKIAVLVDSPTLRKQMGTAARQSAHARFSEANFDDKLLTAYSKKW